MESQQSFMFGDVVAVYRRQDQVFPSFYIFVTSFDRDKNQFTGYRLTSKLKRHRKKGHILETWPVAWYTKLYKRGLTFGDIEHAPTPKYDVAVYQTPLEDGLTRKQIQTLLFMFDENVELIPINVSENNTTAHGFMNADLLQRTDVNEGELHGFIEHIIDDANRETPDHTCEYKGIKFFIGYPE